MKIIVIGGVAAGTSAAAKARRNDESAVIKLYDMDYDISYSGCGLPYYIGSKIENRNDLVPRDAIYFKKKYNIDVLTRHKVIDIDKTLKTLTILSIDTQDVFSETYDKLIIATGATAMIPKIEGVDKPNVFVLRNVKSADKIHNFIMDNNPKSALIVGSGFIGLEMAENLMGRGIDTTIVEMADHAMAALDNDMAAYLEDYLKKMGVTLILNDSVTQFDDGRQVTLISGKVLDADFVIISVGIRPNVELALKAGVELGVTGAIKVNTKMQTSIEDIYSCGDCTESFSIITNKPIYRPLGSTANKTGRIAGDQVTGGDLEFKGILGTGIFKVFNMTVAQTGLSEREAIKEGYDVEVCHNIKPDKSEYFGGKEMVIKAIADKKTNKILGVQIIGESGVDKRIDVFATAMSFGAKAEDLIHLDLAYAPPFSTTKDPVMYTGMILENALKRGRKLITPNHLKEKTDADQDITIIDARVHKQFEESHIEGAINIPQENIREQIKALNKDKEIVVYCNKGVTGNAVQNIILGNGFKDVLNLSGGFKNYKIYKNYENYEN